MEQQKIYPIRTIGVGMLAVVLALLTGCGESDGTKEWNEGWAAYEVRDLKKAAKLFEKSIRANGENVDALVAYARTQLDLGEISSARDTLAKASARAEKDSDVILLGAQLAYHAKDYAQSVRTFTAFANDATREPQLRAEAFVGLAVVEMTCNEHETARIALLKALLLDRRNAAARYHLGRIYRDLGYDEAALEQFEAFVMLDKIADIRVQRVQRQIIPALKEALARKATERPGAAQRNSALSSKNLQRAEAEWKKGNFKKAKAYYADAFKADPLSYPAALGLAQAWEKTDATTKGKRQALTCYQTACSLKPGAIKTLIKTATLATTLNSPGIAAEAYSRTLAVAPKQIDAIDGLIRTLRKKGDTASAARWQGYRDMLKK